MKIIIAGNPDNITETLTHISTDLHNVIRAPHLTMVDPEDLLVADLVIDFECWASPGYLASIGLEPDAHTWLLLNLPDCQLTGIRLMVPSLPTNTAIFNGWPGMVKRNAFEVATDSGPVAETALTAILAAAGLKPMVVLDKVGQITLPIICMIINEGYFTAQEGTATPEDIDTSMLLGTNYPYGPFQWASIFGVKNVYRMLQALAEDTNNPRYRISHSLKTAALKQIASEDAARQPQNG